MASRCLIIYRVDSNKISNQGVIQKLDGQTKGFVDNGWEVDTIRIAGSEIMFNDNAVKKMSRSKFGSVLFEFFQTIGSVIDMKEYYLMYIRYGLSFTGFIGFLKEARSENRNLKIVLEFPTYPYTDEWTGAKGLVVRKVDNYYRKKLNRYVDYAVHLGNEKSILGMPCINSENGIDVEAYKVRSKSMDDPTIRLIAVGKWQFWHGLDRLIKGISEANDLVKEIELHVVGDGPSLQSLIKLTAYLKLRGTIKFHGPQKEEALDKLFDIADIGIGTLGMHRKGIKLDSSLKHREYAARGLPFILCTPDNDFPQSLKFVKYFQQSDTSIDLESIKAFYKVTRNISPQVIRSYASEQLDWRVKTTKILESIKS